MGVLVGCCQSRDWVLSTGSVIMGARRTVRVCAPRERLKCGKGTFGPLLFGHVGGDVYELLELLGAFRHPEVRPRLRRRLSGRVTLRLREATYLVLPAVQILQRSVQAVSSQGLLKDLDY